MSSASPNEGVAGHTARSPRVLSNYSKSSAFSECAKPDEDWTKIADLAMRRRVQNRIAQRRYRMTLKRKSQDAQRRDPEIEAEDKAEPQQKTTRTRSRSAVESSRLPTTSNRPASIAVAPRASDMSLVTPVLEDEETMPQMGFNTSRDLFQTSYGTTDMMYPSQQFNCQIDPPASPRALVPEIPQAYPLRSNLQFHDWRFQNVSPMTSPIFPMGDPYNSPTFSPAQATEASPMISGMSLFSGESTITSPPMMDHMGESPDIDTLLTPHIAPLNNLDETCMSGNTSFDPFYPLIAAEDSTWRFEPDMNCQ